MRALGAALALCMLSAAVPCLAQAPAEKYAGRQVSAVAVLIERRPAAEPALTELIETRVGETLALAEVRESITHLYSLGRFQDVQVDAVDSGGGVELRYNLIPLHHVERVSFKGTLGLSEGLVRRTMSDRFGATPPVGRAAEVVRVLEQLYADHGYFQPTIRPVATELHDPDRTLLDFEIDAGPQTAIARVVLSGQPRASHQAVMAKLGIAEGRPYERALLQRRLNDYVDDLKKQRYYQATANHTAVLSQDRRTADLTIELQSGPLVRVTFQGETLPQDRIRELIPIERERSADEDMREDSAQRIRDYLRGLGHWKADVTVEERATPEQLEVVFTIRKGPVYRVAGLDITGATSIPVAEMRPLLQLDVGDVFVAERLDAGVAGIRQLYRSRGFAWVDVTRALTEVGLSGEGRVRPSVAIKEGQRALVGEVTISGADKVREDDLRPLIKSRAGMPWHDPVAAGDREAILLAYLNRGFAAVEVTATPVVSTDRSRVDLLFSIREGPQILVGHVLVVGNRRTDEDVIRREILLRPGAPLGLENLIESRRRLSALGLFRRVNITEVAHSGAERRDVVITVEEAALTNLGYGGGLEISRVLRQSGSGAEERLDFAPRGFFEIGRRHLGDKNRSVNLYTRLSVRFTEGSEDPEAEDDGVRFGDYRVVGTFREPRPFNWNAEFTLTGAAEQGERASFNFRRRGTTAELLRRLTPSLRGSFRYSLGTTEIFGARLAPRDQATIDRLFPQVRLSAFSGAVVRDTRDDGVDPTRGAFLSAEATLAARALGGQVGFVKSYVQGLWFGRLPGARGVVFATRAATGLADGFPRTAQTIDENGNPVLTPIEDLPASERFFAGGDNTIRGFALDTVGAPNTINAQGFPKGGNAVVIMNAELRIPMWRKVGAAVFLDGGNVFDRVTEFDAAELRGSAGFGLRYRSPIGTVRLDLGFKMERRETVDGRERPSVLHFSIGQAF